MDKKITRYSDVYDDDRRQQGWWYFTTHGVMPGSIPRGVNVLEVKDGRNRKGTWGTYVRLDAILNTSELERYDIKELVPMNEDANFGRRNYTVTFNTNDGYILKSLTKDFLDLPPALDYAKNFDDDLLWTITDEKKNVVYTGWGHHAHVNSPNDWIKKIASEYVHTNESLNESLVRYTFTDGMEITASSEEEAIKKYEDIEKNRSKDNRPIEELDDIAQELYDNEDDFSFHYFSDDELVSLWVECCTNDAAYDDEVYEAISDFPNSKELFDRAKKIIIELNKKMDYGEWDESLTEDIDEYDDEFYQATDGNYYKEIQSKTVYDIDGFTTDYTLYMKVTPVGKDTKVSFVTVFGDKELYRPEDGYYDFESNNSDEAFEWFDDYEGFEEKSDLDDYTPELTQDDMQVGKWYESLNESGEITTLAKLSNGLEVIKYDYGYAVSDGYLSDRFVIRNGSPVFDDGRFKLSDKDKAKIKSLIQKGTIKPLKEDVYRQYEDPYKLENELERLNKYYEENPDEYDDYAAQKVAELKDRINFAWQDDEYDEYNESLKEGIFGNYTPYDPNKGWTEEDIELHKSIDWEARDYADYDAGDAITSEVVLYGLDEPEYADVEMHKFLRSNPIYPPYYKAVMEKPFGMDIAYVGPMYDGNTHGTYDIHDRYDTQEHYDLLTSSYKSDKNGKTISEMLNDLDMKYMNEEVDKYYDLKNLYEAVQDRLTPQEKQELKKKIDSTNDPELISSYLNQKLNKEDENNKNN